MAPYQSRTPGADLTGYLTRYHTDDFLLHNDGVPLDKERLLAHVRVSRRNATQVHVEVHDALVSAEQVAARYTLSAVMRRGQVITMEIHMFGELAPDGRLRRVEQLTRDVSTQRQG